MSIEGYLNMGFELIDQDMHGSCSELHKLQSLEQADSAGNRKKRVSSGP